MEIDISNEFSKLTQDYYRKVVFEVDNGKLNIFEFVFYNIKNIMQKLTPISLQLSLKRNDVENVKK